MEYKKLKLSIILICGIALSNIQAQTLDRIAISSGGNSTDEVSYVIGEVFNLSLSDGNYSFDTGTQGGTGNTGGDNNYTTIEQIATLNLISCYPNPASDIIYFNFKGEKIKNISIQIFDISGEVFTDYDTDHDADQVDELVKRMIIVISKPMSRTELMEKLDLKHTANFRENYLNPAMESGYIEMTLPDTPKSKKQKYRLTEKGIKLKKN